MHTTQQTTESECSCVRGGPAGQHSQQLPRHSGVMASSTSRMAATISKQGLEGKGPLSFEQILADPINLNYFKKFCATASHETARRGPRRPAHTHGCSPPPRRVRCRSVEAESAAARFTGRSAHAFTVLIRLPFREPRHGRALDRESALLAGGLSPRTAPAPPLGR